MPRGPRLDAPQALHHVVVRGLERRAIFRDASDREAFLNRLRAIIQATDLTLLAWALLPNHAHLLVRTSPRPNAAGRGTLATAMRRLLTGYAITFNRRHRRSGHLFQNRYKSILVEEEPYVLELVRYIHLNPLRAGLARNLEELDGLCTRFIAALRTIPLSAIEQQSRLAYRARPGLIPAHFLGYHHAVHLAIHWGQIRTLRNLYRTTRGQPARFHPDNPTFPRPPLP